MLIYLHFYICTVSHLSHIIEKKVFRLLYEHTVHCRQREPNGTKRNQPGTRLQSEAMADVTGQQVHENTGVLLADNHRRSTCTTSLHKEK
jgi:hypothetical protein